MFKASSKSKWLRLSLSLIVALGILLTASPVMAANGYMRGAGGGGGNGGGGGSGSTLTTTEIDWLTYMREEEKLARDVYLVMYEKWGAPIFSNIASSEQRHTDALETLIDKYEIPDPVTDETTLGNFADPELNAMYDELVTRGLSSPNEAYRVGVDIEIKDIGDLEEAMRQTDRTDIDNVYGNLLEGSLNHLAAFQYKL